MFLYHARRQSTSLSVATRRLVLARQASTSTLTLGIRREDPTRLWERRVPLTPSAVEHLIDTHGVRILVQPCARRVFPTNEYLKAGAELDSSLEAAHIILGIKETPLDQLITQPTHDDRRSRTHFMFSHTVKGQPYNAQLFQRFTSSNARLIDYELLADAENKRVVAFGWYAGAAGAVEGLVSVAHDHLTLGVSSPFLLLPRPFQHRRLKDIEQSLRDIGKLISKEGTPEATGPFIIAVTGSGNVAKGALDVLKSLPVKYISADELANVAQNPHTDRRYVYVLHVKPNDYLVDTTGASFSRENYYSQPQRFDSHFAERIAPYVSLLINGTGWQKGCPRLMTNQELAQAQRRAAEIGKARFRTVADVSCDIEGGLEFLSKHATIDDPFFTARPKDHPSELPGIQVMSVDILPAEMPLDASKHFSSKLLPYLETLIRIEQGKSLNKDDERNAAVLERGTMVKDGKVASQHAWLSEHYQKIAQSQRVSAESSPSSAGPIKKKRVVLLGSGMVAGPTVEEIAKRNDVELIVASNNLQEASALVAGKDLAKATYLDTNDIGALESLISQADVVISLLPVPFHPSVAKLCIKAQKHLITASYVSPDMKSLHEAALNADVLLLNEIGLDPGIDHCSAVDLRNRLRSQGKSIASFISVCGGLPSPEFSDVPLGYKFSWSPRGVLTAGLNSARFRLANKDYEVPGAQLFKHAFSDFPLAQGLAMECLPNRDSYPYADTYDIGPVQNLESMFRGTLRYRGFSRLMSNLKTLGLLDLSSPITLREGGWPSLVPTTLQTSHEIGVASGDSVALERAISSIVPGEDLQEVMEALNWFSIIPSTTSGDSIMPPVPNAPLPALDLFALVLAHKLRYAPNERDMVFLSHELVSRSAPQGADSALEEIHTSTLFIRGTSKHSAMALSVGLPVAYAALRVLDGRVKVRGVMGPTADVELYKPILDDLEGAGLGMKETSRKRTVGAAGEQSGLAQRMVKSLATPTV